MARVQLTPTAITLSGVLISATTGTADDFQATNASGNMFIYADNTDGAATRDITIKAQGSIDGASFKDETITIALSSFVWLGPFERAVFNTSGQVQIDLDAGNEGDLDLQAFLFTPATS